MAEHFDPSDLGPQVVDMANGETGELLPDQKTPESAWIPDTNGDPVGSEQRATQDPVHLPDFYYRKYALDGEGKPLAQKSRVDGIMDVFKSKRDTTMTFSSKDDEQRKKEEDYYLQQVQTIADGLLPLCEVDPQSTGINFLQLTTRTWAEFASIAYEYKEETEAANPNDDLPTWLIEREDKMFGLGRKARMLSAVVGLVGENFGLQDLGLKDARVQNEIERRQQRLAEWNFKQHADSSVRVSTELNNATKEHTKNVFSAA
tara:strand:+ start:624 stop:1403 length:780 start_codon:yes stop_codon:yes gene_type:complete